MPKCLFIGLLFHTIDFMLLLMLMLLVSVRVCALGVCCCVFPGACLVVLILYFVQHLPFRYGYGCAVADAVARSLALLPFAVAAPFNFVYFHAL